MGQTNIQVPIENRDPNAYVQENRRLLKPGERRDPHGPAALAETPRSPGTTVLHHNSLGGHEQLQAAEQAPDMRYLDHTLDAGSTVAGMPTTGRFKQHMSGRAYSTPDPTVEETSNRLHLGGDYSRLPHGKDNWDHTKGGMPPADLGKVLPKDA